MNNAKNLFPPGWDEERVSSVIEYYDSRTDDELAEEIEAAFKDKAHTCTIRLDSMDGERSLEIEAMVDTGASYTIVPANLLRDLGVEPIDKITLFPADGHPVQYDIGQAIATINDRSIHTLVVFGDDNARALLGAYTLEGLRLAVDPAHGRLIPATTAWA